MNRFSHEWTYLWLKSLHKQSLSLTPRKQWFVKISLIILWSFKFHTFLQRSHTFSSFKENFSQSLWLILINGSNHNHIKVIMAPQRALFRLSAFGETLDLLLITIFEMKKIWKDFFRSWVLLYFTTPPMYNHLPLWNNINHKYKQWWKNKSQAALC